MRCFLAIGLSGEAEEAVARAQREFNAMFQRAKVAWVDPNQFHLTLLFLGDVPVEQVSTLREVLREGEYPGPFALTLTQPGCFPDRERPQTLTIETTDHPFISVLRKTLASAALRVGINFDQKPFVPHVTVGRVKATSEGCVLERIHVDRVAFDVVSFELIESELGPSGATHTIVESYRL